MHKTRLNRNVPAILVAKNKGFMKLIINLINPYQFLSTGITHRSFARRFKNILNPKLAEMISAFV